MFYLVNFKFRNPDTGEEKVIQYVTSKDKNIHLDIYGRCIFKGHSNLENSKWFNTFNKKYKYSKCLVSIVQVFKAETVLEIKQSKHYKDKTQKRWCVVDGVYYPSLTEATKAVGCRQGVLHKAFDNGQRYYKPRGQSKEYCLNEVGPRLRKNTRIKVNGKIFKSVRSVQNFYGCLGGTMYNHIVALGKPDKGTFTYKGIDYHFEFLGIKEK